MPMRFLGMRHGRFWHYISISLSSAMIVADKYILKKKRLNTRKKCSAFMLPVASLCAEEDGWFACVKIFI